MVYLTAFFVSLFSLISKKFVIFRKKISLKAIFFFLASTILILINCLRSTSVGRDGVQYYEWFTQAASESYYSIANSWQQGAVPSAYLLFEFFFAHILKIPYNLYLFFVSLVSILPFTILIYKESKNIPISVLLYVCLGTYCFQLSAVRQSISMGCLALAYLFSRRKKIVGFLAFCFISTLFHLSSLVFLIAYPLMNIKSNKITTWLLISSSLLFFVVGPYLFDLISKMYTVNTYDVDPNSGGFRLYFVLFAIVCVSFLLSSSFYMKEQSAYAHLVMVICYIIFWPIFRFNTSTFRALYIFLFFFSLFIADCYFSINDKGLKITYLLFVCVFALGFFFTYVLNTENMYNNYSFFWNA